MLAFSKGLTWEINMIDLKKALMTVSSSNLNGIYDRALRVGEPAYQSNYNAISEFNRGNKRRGDRLVHDMERNIDDWIRAMEVLKDESRKII